jgi:hypothetical protein
MKIGYFTASTPITALSPRRFKRAQAFLNEKGIELVSGSLTGKNRRLPQWLDTSTSGRSQCLDS